MPRSDPGSSGYLSGGGCGGGGLPLQRVAAGLQRGFTLIEVMVVVALIAIATGVVSLALRDGRADRLEREAARLCALLESARAEARAAALPVRWMLTPESSEHQFRFIGLPPSRQLPSRWLDDTVVAQVISNRGVVVLGPEALIGAQRLRLSIDDQHIEITTDGLRPFAPLPVGAAAP